MIILPLLILICIAIIFGLRAAAWLVLILFAICALGLVGLFAGWFR